MIYIIRNWPKKGWLNRLRSFLQAWYLCLIPECTGWEKWTDSQCPLTLTPPKPQRANMFHRQRAKFLDLTWLSWACNLYIASAVVHCDLHSVRQLLSLTGEMNLWNITKAGVIPWHSIHCQNFKNPLLRCLTADAFYPLEHVLCC